jgi:hypothetical protein
MLKGPEATGEPAAKRLKLEETAADSESPAAGSMAVDQSPKTRIVVVEDLAHMEPFAYFDTTSATLSRVIATNRLETALLALGNLCYREVQELLKPLTEAAGTSGLFNYGKACAHSKEEAIPSDLSPAEPKSVSKAEEPLSSTPKKVPIAVAKIEEPPHAPQEAPVFLKESNGATQDDRFGARSDISRDVPKQTLETPTALEPEQVKAEAEQPKGNETNETPDGEPKAKKRKARSQKG